MKIKEFLINFIIMFTITLIVATIVTYLWNFIAHGVGAFDWETSFRFALIFGILFPSMRLLEYKKKRK